MIECKNYSKEIKNPEFDQMIGRFNGKRGKFGIIVCRKIKDRSELLKHQKDAMNDDKGVILVLDDKDISKLLTFKAKSEENEIDCFFEEKLDSLIM